MKARISLLLGLLLLLSACQVPSAPPALTTSPVTEPPETSLPVIRPVTDPPATDPITTVPVTTPPPEPITYTDVTLLSAGDIMFHGRNVQAGYDRASGTYSFTEVFQYLSPIVSRYDYAVANLETTFSGAASGYTDTWSISFNTPDEGLDAIRDCGFDMMLFANNHTNDRRLAGLTRTVTKVREKEMDLIGASDVKDGQMWQVVDVKGTKIGMLNYTNDGSWSENAKGTLNGSPLGDSVGYVNVFYLAELDAFYRKVEQDIAAMKAAGAELTVCYIHWGPEYAVEPRKNTKQIAQTLCDLGVDAIIGSHPHVVQPMEVLTNSADPSRKTVCFYSLGNLISNQNRKSLSEADCYGNDPKNTENGLMVALTVRKYSTGQTLIVSAEAIPTWVHRYDDTTTWQREYRIIPLESALTAPKDYGLEDSSFGVTHATASLAYTKALLAEDLAAYLATVTLPAGTEDAVRQPDETKNES